VTRARACVSQVAAARRGAISEALDTSGARRQSRDAVDDIAAYYRNSNEDGRADIAQLEFAVTERLLAHYFPAPARLLELGAGSGRYTERLTRAGHAVTAMELVPELCTAIRARLDQAGLGGRGTVLAADALLCVSRRPRQSR